MDHIDRRGGGKGGVKGLQLPNSNDALQQIGWGLSSVCFIGQTPTIN